MTRPFPTRHSGARLFGAMRFSCTKPLPVRRTAASVPASRRKPRCRSASRSIQTRCRKQQIKAAKVNLDDPATIALLKLNAVIGVTAFANPDGSPAMGRHSSIVKRRRTRSGNRGHTVREPLSCARQDLCVSATSRSRAFICMMLTAQRER